MKNFFAISLGLWMTASLIVWFCALPKSTNETWNGDTVIRYGVIQTEKIFDSASFIHKFFWAYYEDESTYDYSDDRFGDREPLLSMGTLLTWLLAVICFWLAFIVSEKQPVLRNKIKLLFLVAIPYIFLFLKIDFLIWVNGLY